MPPRILLILALLCAVPGLSRRAGADDRVDRLIAQLGDPDVRQREAAEKALLGRGQEVRDALKEAAECPFPEIAARAQRLLMVLPWDTEEDPPVVREILKDYGNQTEAGRQRLLQQLTIQRLPDPVLGRILARILIDEPSETVRWSLFRLIRGLGDRTAPVARFRQLDAQATTSAAVTCCAGWAWSATDPAKAEALLERAIDLLPPAASYDPSFLFEAAAQLQIQAHHEPEAAETYRRWERFGPSDSADPESFAATAQLFALHARSGPLPGFGRDVLRHAFDLADPEIVYALGILTRRHLGPTPAVPVWASAIALGGVSQARHYRAASFLLSIGELELAQREFHAVLWLWAEPLQKLRFDCSAHFRLGNIAGIRQEDQAAGDHIAAALALIDDNRGGPQRLSIPAAYRRAVEIKMHHHLLRAAQARKDEGAVAQHLAQLVSLAPTDGAVVPDMTALLKERGQVQDARRLFEAAYQRLKGIVDLEGTPNNRNELAWLCARSGERLDEALTLATQAIEAAPDNGAFLDTAAEIHFRLGHRQQAIELESRAIQLRPDDPFLKDQLQRFKEAR